MLLSEKLSNTIHFIVYSFTPWHTVSSDIHLVFTYTWVCFWVLCSLGLFVYFCSKSYNALIFATNVLCARSSPTLFFLKNLLTILGLLLLHINFESTFPSCTHIYIQNYCGILLELYWNYNFKRTNIFMLLIFFNHHEYDVTFHLFRSYLPFNKILNFLY